MSLTVHVEYQYCQHGRKTVQTGSDLVTVDEHTDRAVLSVLRLLHPHWEAIKVLSSSLAAPPETTPGV
ncbi:hypothetical protein [Paraburkholderia caballeronis]|uniref:Uncharacterized protein n=1 Tax=Paraburkholderia caballeronis TaxID=416943 RepID=A0A1H7UAR9_9BURK|nr:hypothetical protein [Paraburkholderia caballeronis]PXW23313.1 hypothetical protein C7403_11050 [Paraburkholderia caballeronis]PXW98306.1 hypothetical protein C7407_11050 [Paraburkholderia caballeronis]RAJ95036.1 hypothetical protein C7409_11050 [Paraburkholderia caballeronis]TDV09448.1 hypothetical protein C7408_11528 [Paraburkholderia caballeronis]TDV13719.1 hypothetical protein C7406_11628 [Paraburkholderia caballeronis]